MKNPDKILLPLLTMALTGTAAASPVSPDEALARLRQDAPARIASFSASPLRLSHTLYADTDREASVYVFNSKGAGSFIVAPADDLAPAVLGYSDNGEFDVSTASPGLLWLLEEYSKEIDYCRQNGLTFNRAPQEERDPVEPLIKTQWNQDAPYNNLCPRDNGVNCYVGCVATATAQVVNYFRCPAEYGTGTYSYNWNGKELSFDYGATKFDWENMALTAPYNEDDYPGTAEEIDLALATLSYACGVGVNMGYSTTASGAYSLRIPRMLSDHFGYDIGYSYLKRDFFGFREWNDMMYAEVAAGRPVLYSGLSDGGGHEFVCDGYSSKNLFHINWGWSGLCDGYFLLAALDPLEQGIGGSTTGGGFTLAQEAVIGIQPAKEGSYRRVPIFGYGPLTPYFDETEQRWYFNFMLGESVAYFFSDRPMTIYLGLRIEDEQGNSVYCYGDPMEMPGIGDDIALSYIDKFTAPYEDLDLAPGIYKAWPAMRDVDGKWQDMRTWYGTSNYSNLIVAEDGTKSFQYVKAEIKGEVAVNDIRVRTQGSGKEAPIFTLEFENVGERDIDDKVMLHVSVPDGTEVLSENGISLILKPQQTVKRNLRWNPFVPGGDYDFVVKDTQGNVVSKVYRLHLDPVDYPVLNVSDFNAPEVLPNGKRSTLTFNVGNTGTADYKGDITMRLYDVGKDIILAEKSCTAEVKVNGSEECQIKWKPEVPDGLYEMAFVNSNGQKVSQRYGVTVGDASAVESAIVGNDNFTLYSIDGRFIGEFSDENVIDNLSSGIYIMRKGDKAFKVIK